MATHLILTATEGPLKAQEFAFTGQVQVLIGRSSDCSLRLADDQTVSRRHCLVGINEQGAWVRDLESLNGTFVNDTLVGYRLRDGEEDNLPLRLLRLLHDGDELRVGTHTFRVGVMAADPVEDGSKDEMVPGQGDRELFEACA
jgi:pSer/pThr/pTyr-binding forkhead associated (FHA) protein